MAWLFELLIAIIHDFTEHRTKSKLSACIITVLILLIIFGIMVTVAVKIT